LRAVASYTPEVKMLSPFMRTGPRVSVEARYGLSPPLLLEKESQAERPSKVQRDRMTSSQLYGVDLAGDLKGKDFPVGT
jgi:hypothetical protein